MKIILMVICLLTFTHTFSQRSNLNRLWIGDANNYLKFDTAFLWVESWFTHEGKVTPSAYGMRYAIIGDTLRIFKEETQKTVDNNFARITVHDDFLISRATDDELKLHSLGRNSWILAFTGRDPLIDLTYRAQPTIYTDTIHFEKILLKTVRGPWGGAPVFSVQIDSTKQVKYLGQENVDFIGSYTGTLSDQLYTGLLNILAISDLDNWVYRGRYNVDVLASILEVHYNNKVKYIKAFTRHMPLMSQALGDLMFNISNQVELKKAELVEIPFSQ